MLESHDIEDELESRHGAPSRRPIEMVLSALLRLQSARPSTTALLLGGGIMAVGDSVVQYGVEDRDALDKTRLAVCSAYNASVAVPLQFWYAYLDRVWPSGYFISKVLLNQLVSSSTLTPGFLATTSCVETVMDGRGLLAGLEATRDTLQREVVTLATQSFFFWTPVNAVMFAKVPQNLRIGYMSVVSVCWSGYCSWVAHRGPSPPPRVA